MRITLKVFSSTCVVVLASLLGAVQAQTNPWQQKVAYKMDIQLWADRHQVDGSQVLTYTNNSPDTLRMVFYHLYFNAFQPNSMMAERNRHLPDPDGRIVPRIFNLKEDEIGWQKILHLSQDGMPVKWSIWDTVMKVELAKPILPGASTTFSMQFKSQVPLQTRRSGRDNAEGVDYSMCQWYPKLAHYDERGWHTDPYVGREFYAPYGSFDVKLKLPKNYVVGATGLLQNPNDVGHGYADRPVSPPADSLVWHFKGENIHDFAWVADPDYIHEKIMTKIGVPIHVLYLATAKTVWANAKSLSQLSIDKLSELFGKYPHPVYTVAQAGDGGMEYPMIIFLAGKGLAIVHEGAHQWFYSILGSNETDYAWMDEGFTSYATTEVNSRLANREPVHLQAYSSIFNARRLGYYEPLSTPSDWFATNSGYSTAAYSGGQMMAAMLGYVIGDAARDRWFMEYYQQYKFKHPDPHDLELLAEKVSGLQLDWFFDQWTLRNWKNDYAIQRMKSEPVQGGFLTTLVLARKGRMAMPLDLQLQFADGSSKWVNVPLSEMMGHKSVPQDWIVATPWGWTSPQYTLQFVSTSQLTFAEIDPQGRMLDDDRLNNTSTKWFPAQTAFMRAQAPTLFRYGQHWSPFATYSKLMGLGIGAQYKGNYLYNDHKINTSATLFSTVGGTLQIHSFNDALAFLNYDFSYEKVSDLLAGTRVGLSFDSDLGIVEDRFWLTKSFNKPLETGVPQRSLTLAFIHNDRITKQALETTPFMGKAWHPHNTLTGLIGYRSQQKQDFWAASLEMGSAIRQEAGASSTLRFQMKAQKTYDLGKKSSLVARALAGVGSEDLVFQKQFFLGHTDFETLWRNDATRFLTGLAPQRETFFAAFSGVGPVAYLAHQGGQTKIMSGSLVLDLGTMGSSSLLRPLRLQAFSGTGYQEVKDRFIADAGLSAQYHLAALTKLNRWAAISDVLSTMNLSLKVPFWVSHPSLLQQTNAIAFRWVLGVEAGF